MDQPTLFEIPQEPPGERPEAAGGGRPRLRTANRHQVQMHFAALDQLLAEDHRVRAVWEYVDGLDLSAFHQEVAAVEGRAGRDANDPRILLTLWLYATVEGVGSARELARLCEDHVVFQWICGGVSMNYHTLSDFRTQQGYLLDGLLTDSVAALLHEGLVTLERVAQDGVRVRAHAGASSFRGRSKLEACLEEAQTQVEALKSEVDADPAAGTRRQKAARKRAARERAARVAQALEALAEVEEKKARRGRDSLKSPARASTTDPDARTMKVADGGFRPAYNVQFSTDTASQVIVGVEVIQEGSDAGQLTPMTEQIESRTGRRPAETLADGGFSTLEEIDRLNDPAAGSTVYVPVKDKEKKRKAGQNPFAPLPTDSPHVAEWRARMGTADAKEIYKQRAATAECVNALARNRGLHQFNVRGRPKVLVVALWYALAHNVLRGIALRAGIALATK